MVDRSLKRRRAMRDFRQATARGELASLVSAAVACAFADLPRHPTREDWDRCWEKLEELGFESPNDPADPNYQLVRSIMQERSF